MSDFFIPSGEASSECIVKKSRFIASVVSIESREEVKEILELTWEKHPQARHIVHAFVFGPKGEHVGMSDDGEPHGTAGHPVLDLLKGRALTDVLAVVVRYFGGTKLGTGGLVSAYSQSVRLALDKLPVTLRIDWSHFSVSLSYELLDDFLLALLRWEGVVENKSFGTKVIIEFYVPVKNRTELKRDLLNISRGAIQLY